jgi:integrase
MVWTPATAGQFLDYAQRHDIALYHLFELILHRGLRRGEACGLTDTNVDLDTATLTITEQITTVGYTPITTTVKSDASNRTISLAAATVASLRQYVQMRQRWTQVSGEQWPGTGLFFVQPNGQPWHPATVTDRFEYLIKHGGFPPVRLHDLRHAAATYLRAAGADMKEVQTTLGHATMAMTSDIYTSVILELERANADAAADLIPRQHAA